MEIPLGDGHLSFVLVSPLRMGQQHTEGDRSEVCRDTFCFPYPPDQEHAFLPYKKLKVCTTIEGEIY
jgi:hypothetical protein